jgi:outer membrane protein OmpA-like peptidoglycan-associated protein
MRGYLAEINSAAENSFIGTETTATNVWIGATDAATEGTWIWDGATSTPKPTGNGTNAGPTASYQSWAGGEPNEHSSGGPSGEDCAVTNWQGAVGMWNDLPCGSAYSYLIEYGGRPSEASTAITVTETIPINAVNPTVISVAPIGGVTVPATGGTPVSTVTAANGYTGTVTWSPSGTPFAASTSYTATITLTAASAYTLTGVSANFFTIAGATSVTHSANSGIITAVFPATAISPPAFTISPISETITVGSPISGYTITPTGGTIASYSISPAISNTPGLSFDTATGLISGTPTTAASSAAYTITATNATSSATRTFTITVNPVAPAFTISTNSVSGVQGTSITGYSISSSGGPIESFSISPSISNAPGLSFSTSTGLISGTPSAPSGLRTYTVTASNAAGSTSRTFELKVDSPPIPAVIKDPEQRSSIASISQGCPIDSNIIVIKGSFLSPIGNIHINNQAISSSLWKQSASEVVITLTSAVARMLSIQIFNGQLPLLPSQSVSIAASCATPTPTAKPTPTPTATPTPKPTPTPTATPTPKPTPKPTPTATNQQPNTQMVKVETAYMASGTYFLNDATKRTLIAAAKKINASGAKSILIYGHADSRGGVDNTLLSQNRAKAVAKFIRPLLTSKNISVGWFSSNKPAKAGNSAAAQALNRRVEIYTK